MVGALIDSWSQYLGDSKIVRIGESDIRLKFRSHFQVILKKDTFLSIKLLNFLLLGFISSYPFK